MKVLNLKQTQLYMLLLCTLLDLAMTEYLRAHSKILDKIEYIASVHPNFKEKCLGFFLRKLFPVNTETIMRWYTTLPHHATTSFRQMAAF